MFKRNNKPARDPASKSGVKGPRPYQGYLIALIILLIVIFYSVMYW